MNAPVKSYAQANLRLIEGFERWLLAKNYSRSTQDHYSKVVRSLCEFLGPEDLTFVDLHMVRTFLIKHHGKSSAAYQGARVAVLAFYRFLILGRVLENAPASLIRRPKLRRPLPRCLTEKETERLIAAGCSPRDRALLELFYASGLRANEVSNLRIEELNLESGTLMVTRGKGNKDRLGMLGSKAIEAVRVYLGRRRRGLVFLNHRRQQLSTQTIREIVKDTARRAGLDGVHPHTLRHTFATVLLNRGADIRYIQEFLGHERVATTAIYLQTAIADLTKVHELYHPHSQGDSDEPQG